MTSPTLSGKGRHPENFRISRNAHRLLQIRLRIQRGLTKEYEAQGLSPGQAMLKAHYEVTAIPDKYLTQIKP